MHADTDNIVGILLITHYGLGESLIQIATHIMAEKPKSIESLSVTEKSNFESLVANGNNLLRILDNGKGVVLLTDLFGATPFNVTKKIAVNKKVTGVSGVNLPMLLKALTYRTLPLDALTNKITLKESLGIAKIITS